MKNKTEVEGWAIGVAEQQIRESFQWATDIVTVRRPESLTFWSVNVPGHGRSDYGCATPCRRKKRPTKGEPRLTAQRALHFVARQPAI
jgi:hypothetical protein